MPTPPITARALVAILAPYRPRVERAALGFDLNPPEELVSLLSVLHTGIRALLTGRKWFGCGSEQAMAAPRPLNPDTPILAQITLFGGGQGIMYPLWGPVDRNVGMEAI